MKYIIIMAILTSLSTSDNRQITLTYADTTFSYQLSLDSILTAATDGLNYDCVLKVITVTRLSDKKIIQKIIENDLPTDCLPKEQIFIIEDVNFDGLNDLRLIQVRPYSKNTYFYWTFNSETQQFKRDISLEEITTPIFDKKTKTISSSSNVGCSQGLTSETGIYKYQNGKIVLIEQTERQVYFPTNTKTLIKRKIINGKLTEIERTTE